MLHGPITSIGNRQSRQYSALPSSAETGRLAQRIEEFPAFEPRLWARSVYELPQRDLPEFQTIY
jgi:hypothetical protein